MDTKKKWLVVMVATLLVLANFTFIQPERSSANNSITSLSKNYRIVKLTVNGEKYNPQYDSDFQVVYFEDIAYETLEDNSVEAEFVIQPLNSNKITSIDSNVMQGPGKNLKDGDYEKNQYTLTFTVDSTNETMVLVQTEVSFTDSKNNAQKESFNTEFYFYSDPTIKKPADEASDSEETDDKIKDADSTKPNKTTKGNEIEEESVDIELEIIHHPSKADSKGVWVKGATKRVLVELYKDNDLIDVKQTDTLGKVYFNDLQEGVYRFVVDGKEEKIRIRESDTQSKKDEEIEENEDLIKEYVQEMFEDLLDNRRFLETYRNMQDEKRAAKVNNRLTIEDFADKYSLLFREYERTNGNKTRINSSNDFLYDMEYLEEKKQVEKQLDRKIRGFEDDKDYQDLFEKQVNLHLNFLQASVNQIKFDDDEDKDEDKSNTGSTTNNNSDSGNQSQNETDDYYQELYFQLLAEYTALQQAQQMQQSQPQSVQPTPSQPVQKQASATTPATSTTNNQQVKASGTTSSSKEQSVKATQVQKTVYSGATQQKVSAVNTNSSSKKEVSAETKEQLKKIYEGYYRSLDDEIGEGFVDALLGGHITVEELDKEKQEIFNSNTEKLQKLLKDEVGLTQIEAQQILLLDGFQLFDKNGQSVEVMALSTDKVGVPKTGDGSSESTQFSSTLFTVLGLLITVLGIMMYERRKIMN